ncbi:MAG: amidohydrolase [Acidimicrobiales bacterium]
MSGGPRTADTAIFGATVCTVDPRRAATEDAAVAVLGGEIVAVGSLDEVGEWCGPRTEVIYGRGRLLLPGIVDAHVHPPMAGIEMVRCDLTAFGTRAEYVAAVGAYASRHPELEWIRGGGWAMAAFPNGLPVADDLDVAVGSRPVYLPNRDHHSAWVSSRALELAGITASTPDPVDGRIERDDAGRPTGALHEGAMTLVERSLPRLSAADYVEGLVAAQAYLHSLGITSWQDAWVPLHGDGKGAFDAYIELASSGRLTARVVAALWWERDRGSEQVDGLLEARARAAAVGSDRLRATSVKIMQDGVCETFTAAMLTPYLDVHGHDTGNCGLSFVEPEALKTYVTRLDAEGFQVHVHALGDRAVREALDAFEMARDSNQSITQRHHIAHLQVVHPDDLERFAALGVTANFQPLWACEDDQMVELTIPYLGPERAAQQYPIGSLLRRGVPLAFGSDWPVSTPNPLAELHVAVNRTPPPGRSASRSEREAATSWLPDERISLEAGVAAFTMGSAHVNHQEDVCGSIEVGKAADLVLIDRNVFEVDAADGGIAGGQVLLTMVGGEAVYEAPGL